MNEHFNLASLQRMSDALFAKNEAESFVFILRPVIESDLRHALARWNWQHAFHEWRAAGCPGSDDCRTILDRFKDSNIALGDVSAMEGVRFIETLPGLEA